MPGSGSAGGPPLDKTGTSTATATMATPSRRARRPRPARRLRLAEAIIELPVDEPEAVTAGGAPRHQMTREHLPARSRDRVDVDQRVRVDPLVGLAHVQDPDLHVRVPGKDALVL